MSHEGHITVVSEPFKTGLDYNLLENTRSVIFIYKTHKYVKQKKDNKVKNTVHVNHCWGRLEREHNAHTEQCSSGRKSCHCQWEYWDTSTSMSTIIQREQTIDTLLYDTRLARSATERPDTQDRTEWRTGSKERQSRAIAEPNRATTETVDWVENAGGESLDT